MTDPVYQIHGFDVVELGSGEPVVWAGDPVGHRYRSEYEFTVTEMSAGGSFTVERTIAPLNEDDATARWDPYPAKDDSGASVTTLTEAHIGKTFTIKGRGRIRLVPTTDGDTVSAYLAFWA